MGDTTISWLFRPGTRPRSWNPTQGCEMVSPGCKNCYAMRMAARFAKDGWSQGLIDLKTKKWSREGRMATHKLFEPLTWREPSTVFVNSMSDLFWEKFTDEEIAAVFGIMAACPQHVFIIATKRARRMRRWFQWNDEEAKRVAVADPDSPWWRAFVCIVSASKAMGRVTDVEIAGDGSLITRGKRDILSGAGGSHWPLGNVWLLVSVENQEMADERVSHLLHTPAAIRGISGEPLLEAIDLRSVKDYSGLFTIDALNKPPQGQAARLDWVITGCESAPDEDVRPAQTDWFRSLRDQCKAAGVPFFFKQGNVNIEGITANPGAIGRGGVAEPALLDGVLHQEWPW